MAYRWHAQEAADRLGAWLGAQRAGRPVSCSGRGPAGRVVNDFVSWCRQRPAVGAGPARGGLAGVAAADPELPIRF
ncbi:MAG: hypothetical protein R2734_14025 [Nocardioides sp.]